MVMRVAAIVLASLGVPSVARACPSCQLDVNGETWWVIGIFMITPWFVVGAIALAIRTLRKLEAAEDAAAMADTTAQARTRFSSSSGRSTLAGSHLRVVEGEPEPS